METDSHSSRTRARRRDKATLLRRLHPEGEEWGANPEDFDPDSIASTIRWMQLLFGERRYFRVEFDGWDHIPPAPVMVVSNHSGGTTLLDGWGLCFGWYRHFGVRRPIHPAAHEFVVGLPGVGPFFARRGVVRAERGLAREILADWRHDLLVMPGGDIDVWRPFSRRYEVCFGGRTGYSRLALQAKVPIVPLAHVGAHHSLMVLSEGQWLAEKVGLQRLARAHIWPIHLSLPWVVGFGPLPHLPLPVRLRYRFGAPIVPPDLAGSEPSEEQILALDSRVRTAIQSQLDHLKRTGSVLL